MGLEQQYVGGAGATGYKKFRLTHCVLVLSVNVSLGATGGRVCGRKLCRGGRGHASLHRR